MAAIAGPRNVRPAVVAGSFYPSSPTALTDRVDALLEGARRAGHGQRPDGRDPVGVIVPHAGHRYSGPVAAAGYAALASRSDRPRCVVMLGPSHFEPLDGWAVPRQTVWLTPLGEVAIDEPSRQLALEEGVAAVDRVHDREHSLEVQLPFIQRLWPGTPVLPVAVGAGPPDRHLALLTRLWHSGAALVVSTDLSHYHEAAVARLLDARTAAAIEALEHAALRPEDACGYHALRSALAWAGQQGLRVRQLELRDSSDEGGEPWRVVGYGAFAIDRPAS
jgi:AmmeMemoRadiSam system protein B